MLGDEAKEREKELAKQRPGFVLKKPCAGCPKPKKDKEEEEKK